MNEDLVQSIEWITESKNFYSTLIFEIMIYSDGKYKIDANFSDNPDKEADDVFIRLPEYNSQKFINPDDFVDLLFLTRVWDRYFPELYTEKFLN